MPASEQAHLGLDDAEAVAAILYAAQPATAAEVAGASVIDILEDFAARTRESQGALFQAHLDQMESLVGEAGTDLRALIFSSFVDEFASCGLPAALMALHREHRSYDRWLAHIFDHPVGWDMAAADWLLSGATVIGYVTRLFQDPRFQLARFEPGQIDQGLRFLISDNWLDGLGHLGDDGVPWESRRDCARAIRRLFEELYVPACGSATD